MKRHQNLFSWIPPQSGPIALLRLLSPQPVEEFAEDLVNKIGVLIMPGAVFDPPGNYFRVGFGKKNMPDALSLLEKLL